MNNGRLAVTGDAVRGGRRLDHRVVEAGEEAVALPLSVSGAPAEVDSERVPEDVGPLGLVREFPLAPHAEVVVIRRMPDRLRRPSSVRQQIGESVKNPGSVCRTSDIPGTRASARCQREDVLAAAVLQEGDAVRRSRSSR